ncbi:hypothetical protein EB796_010036 [Bugula neritina]|uniref:C2H2-type domain-containing protein n=1 Tax=Bugula neritina TaxID=10212 RepID=A0A7J7K0E3_BUGNE|nr:hypothetical protein EB796_010036 [Bugula neritina]
MMSREGDEYTLPLDLSCVYLVFNWTRYFILNISTLFVAGDGLRVDYPVYSHNSGWGDNLQALDLRTHLNKSRTIYSDTILTYSDTTLASSDTTLTYKDKALLDSCPTPDIVTQFLNSNRQVCSKSYRQVRDYRAHVATHEDAKMYTCDICFFQLSTPSQYLQHLQVIPYSCRVYPLLLILFTRFLVVFWVISRKSCTSAYTVRSISDTDMYIIHSNENSHWRETLSV